MVGTIKQQLYVTGIPKGLTMTEWRATLYDSAERERFAPFTIDPSVNQGYVGEVKMYGAHAFPSNSLGARLEILWKLTGTPTGRLGDADSKVTTDPANDTGSDPGDQAPPTVDPNDPDVWATKLDQLGAADPRAEEPARSGRLIIETTEWGLIQRPDYVAVVYQVGSATPLRVVSKVAATIIDQPDDALFVIGVNSNTQEIGINGVQDKAVSDTLVSYLIQGIFYVHEKAFGWVFGKFW
ncbi:hypothetical protein BDZ89DRAFT_1202401 [Hymenopellis radicata]|nr:hypothetical protein BDZ89DRAFT_1202401 [Hymenopellis radicata]